jgi:hypothetical protein
MRRITLALFALLCTAARPRSRSHPHPRPTTPLRELQYPGDVESTEEHDQARITAYATPPTVHFEVAAAPTVSRGRITLEGHLVNDDGSPHDVIIFPAAASGFALTFVPNEAVRLRPPPPGAPRMPPPVPPPPQRFVIPARSRIAMTAEIPLAGYEFAPGTRAQVEWEYLFQNPPRPSGRFEVVLP